MCGINGYIGFKDPASGEAAVSRMNTALAHRGPDDEGWYGDEHIALGHKRLSIIDLSNAGKQPMQSPDGRYVITYNGELYNFRELKSQLKDYPFSTDTDTEVVLAAFIQWGKDCLQRFNGMFAFAVWDKQEKRLFIARDRLGIKPLYYYQQENQLLFSSELRALISSELIPKAIDETALVDYLRYQTVHTPKTILKEVFMLLPGHYMEMSRGQMNIGKYWSMECQANKAGEEKSYEETCRDVAALMEQSVKRRMIADVPFGAFLSGGIDSSAVVALMSKISPHPVKTFTISFEEEAFSEAKFARQIAEKFKTDHTEIKLRPEDFLRELPAALKAMDHPSGDGPNTYVVSKATKNAGVTMALSGLGGDELFAGYDIFIRSVRLNRLKALNWLPRSLRKASGAFLKAVKPGINSEKVAAVLGQPTIDAHSAYAVSRQVFTTGEISELLSGKQQGEENFVSSYMQGLKTALNGQVPFLSHISMAEISTYLQNILLRDTDQMSMAHALEVRVPFMDHELVEHVLKVPDRHKFPHSPKKLLVDAMEGLLPPDIVNRPKMGFVFPWDKWLRNELKGFCEERLQALARRQYFREEAVMELWERFLAHDPGINWGRVWILVVLENWLEENEVR